jgi:class 3 adenylate cyclase
MTPTGTERKSSKMPILQSKPVDASSDVRTFPRGRAEVVTIDDSIVGRVTYEAGWRWSQDLAPIMGTKTCQLHHVGYAISGVMHIAMDDGLSVDVVAGSAFDIPAGHDAWVVGEAPWVAVAWNSLRSYALPAVAPGERVLATVVFTDIVASTATMERIGDDAWRDLLSAHNERLRDDLNVFRGREVATTGDGFLAVFDSASRAVEGAHAMSRTAKAMGLPIRVGVHTGEVEFIGGNVRGVAVHTAQRVMSQAGPNEVLVSSTTADLLHGAGMRFSVAGTFRLKGLEGRRRLFRLEAPVARP